MTEVKQPTKAQQNEVGVLSQDAHEAGNFVSTDQYIVNNPDRLLMGCGKEQPHN